MKLELLKNYKKYQAIILTNALFYMLSLPLIILGFNQGRAFSDQQHFHMPTIIHFMKSFDFSDYPAAMTPGYHMLIAIVGMIFTPNEVVLKIAGSIFTALLLAVVAKMLSRTFGGLRATVLILPMIFSIYIFPSGVWLLPDNLAWLTVVVSISIATKPLLTKFDFITLGLLLVAAMLVRQPFLWLASLIWAVIIITIYEKEKTYFQAAKYIFWGVVTTLPAFILFYLFTSLWGGVVPPSFQGNHQSISYSSPAFFFSVFFSYSIFFIPLIIALYRDVQRECNWRWIFLGALMGFLLAVFPDTSYSRELGRFSGLWNLVQVFPAINEKSLLIILLSTLGGGCFAFMISTLSRRTGFILLSATLAFVTSLMFNKYVFERYVSGFIFIYIYFVISNFEIFYADFKRSIFWMGPAIFSIINLLILLRGML
ncbi:hypothetical protein [Pseudoalteromonas 'SMAR']|uniref:hypothetical protein n=1 Tax=Pseudoalteromonas 'SMAR' TaxID=3416908 RepID=UPI003AF2E49D